MKALTYSVVTPSMEQNILNGAEAVLTIAGKYYSGEITEDEMHRSAFKILMAGTAAIWERL